ALRMDVMLGAAAEALPEIESRLARIRDWWARAQQGEDVSEAPDVDFLGICLIGGLDVLKSVYLAHEEWQKSLNLIAEQIAVKEARGASEHELARDRFNRYGPLLRLGRLAEAQQELERCLEVFERAGDRGACGSCLSALADVFDEKGDSLQAARLER